MSTYWIPSGTGAVSDTSGEQWVPSGTAAFGAQTATTHTATGSATIAFATTGTGVERHTATGTATIDFAVTGTGSKPSTGAGGTRRRGPVLERVRPVERPKPRKFRTDRVRYVEFVLVSTERTRVAARHAKRLVGRMDRTACARPETHRVRDAGLMVDRTDDPRRTPGGAEWIQRRNAEDEAFLLAAFASSFIGANSGHQ